MGPQVLGKWWQHGLIGSSQNEQVSAQQKKVYWMKRQHTDLKEIFASCTSGGGLVSRIYKDVKNSRVQTIQSIHWGVREQLPSQMAGYTWSASHTNSVCWEVDLSWLCAYLYVLPRPFHSPCNLRPCSCGQRPQCFLEARGSINIKLLKWVNFERLIW